MTFGFKFTCKIDVHLTGLMKPCYYGYLYIDDEFLEHFSSSFWCIDFLEYLTSPITTTDYFDILLFTIAN